MSRPRDLGNAMIISKADVEAALARAKAEFANLPRYGPDRYVAKCSSTRAGSATSASGGSGF